MTIKIGSGAAVLLCAMIGFGSLVSSFGWDGIGKFLALAATFPYRVMHDPALPAFYRWMFAAAMLLAVVATLLRLAYRFLRGY